MRTEVWAATSVCHAYDLRQFSEIDVPPGGRFTDTVALKGSKEIGDGRDHGLTEQLPSALSTGTDPGWGLA